MIEEPPVASEELSDAPAHPIGAIRGVLASLLDAVRTRFDLAAVEAELFLVRTIQMLLWAVAAVACGLLALVFAVVALIAALWDTHRMVGVLGGALLFAILGGVFALIAGRSLRARPHILEGTLAQLETDQHRIEGTP